MMIVNDVHLDESSFTKLRRHGGFMEKVVLITGANKGIGFEVARQLGRAGFTVLLGARDASRGEEAADKLRGEGSDVHFVVADLNRASECGAALAKQIGEEFGHLDGLVNNAGMGDPGDGHASVATIEALRRTFETNFFGTVAFTQQLLPLLRAAEEARIVNVSSALGSVAINGDASSPFYHAKALAYNASKAALNMFTVDMAYDLRETKIKVNSACPGFTATDMTNHNAPQTVEEGAIAIVRLAQLPEDGPTGSFIHKDGTYPW
jgi:NAD(P)-dependent dehydrogenase (short-subunit alcohol dehydrogenase family)